MEILAAFSFSLGQHVQHPPGGRRPGAGDFHSRARPFRRRQMVRRERRALQHRVRPHPVESDAGRDRIRPVGHSLRRLRQNARAGRHRPEPDGRRPHRQGPAIVHGQIGAAANGDHLGRRHQQHGFGGAVLRDRLHAGREVSAGGRRRRRSPGCRPGRPDCGRGRIHAYQRPRRYAAELYRRAAGSRTVAGRGSGRESRGCATGSRSPRKSRRARAISSPRFSSNRRRA